MTTIDLLAVKRILLVQLIEMGLLRAGSLPLLFLDFVHQGLNLLL